MRKYDAVQIRPGDISYNSAVLRNLQTLSTNMDQGPRERLARPQLHLQPSGGRSGLALHNAQHGAAGQGILYAVFGFQQNMRGGHRPDLPAQAIAIGQVEALRRQGAGRQNAKKSDDWEKSSGWRAHIRGSADLYL